MIVFGVFLLAGVVSASDADVLQPASTITYNEDVDVNGTLFANSAYIGEPGIGGVTFFNGTIINNSDDPVTFGDDVRIDGEIFRGSKGGDPIKISDNVIPTLNNANDFGNSSNRWKSVWAKDADFSGNVDFTGANVTGLMINHNHDAKYLIKTGDTMSGNLKQNRSKFGVVKAAAFVDVSADCGSSTYEEVGRYENYLSGSSEPIYCEEGVGAGDYYIKFGNSATTNKVTDKYWNVTAHAFNGSNDDPAISARNWISPDNVLSVQTYINGNKAAVDFMIVVY